MLSDVQRANLDKLASYLEALPSDYEHFDMSVYFANAKSSLDLSTFESVYVANPQQVLNECGTVACALGHGPAAGVHPRPHDRDQFGGIDWVYYVGNFVSWDSFCWSFLFHDQWFAFDNTPHGAAKRIRYILAGNEPLEVGDLSYAN